MHIAYEIYGEEGQPILFIHPPGMGRKVFHYQKQLSSHMKVILIDLPGHGDSSIPMDVSIPYFAEQIFKVVTELGLNDVIVCGYSAGGTIAQEFALNYPHRTRALILSGGFPVVTTKLLKAEFALGIYATKRYLPIVRKVLAISHMKDPHVRKELDEHLHKNDPYTWYRLYEEAYRYNCVDRLHELRAPLLLIYGSKADYLNKYMSIYKQHTPYQAAIVKGAFHQIPSKHWQLFNQIVIGFVFQLLNKKEQSGEHEYTLEKQ
ncbi:alpha/beta fold hydrolase [Metabacillus iocasae]|uniref:Pimeloyl-ACP methyl ester carboxylesterase n=1 Tax=Priestia iocasae TaxID=2291674 RepID=A0ABS2QWE9_9BACI|nr:alpha/beta hydrolase [Metabacillus iocasae]MBM7703791.1 pimeloyl-ACP methyl ester carboxylesterase [Metabacillus iocasae]